MKHNSAVSIMDDTRLLNTRLLVATTGRINVISLHALVRIEALSNYSRLFLADGTTLFVAKGLNKFEKKLDHCMFVRTHNTHLVNLLFIDCWFSPDTLQLTNGEHLPVSRRRKSKVKSYIC